LLALLGAEELARWLAGGSEATFQAGEIIFRQGTPGAWAYLVLDGKVRIFRTTAAERDVTLGTAGPGDFFGEYALLRPGLNTATCRAAAVARLLRLPLAPLKRFLVQRPGVVANLKNWLRLGALVQYLRGQAFLGFLSGPSALKHLPHLESVTVPQLCAIQASGLNDTCWHFLETGQALLHEGGNGRGRELGPGEWFGSQALVDLGHVPTVVALTEVRCLRLTRAAFRGEAPTPASDSCLQTFQKPAEPAPAFEWVGQEQEADCGLACLAMVARHHGLAVTVEQLRERLPPGSRGVSLLELQRLAETLGLPGTAVRIGPAQWGQVRLPAVVHLEQGHFVVLFGLDGGGALVGDPATGVLRENPASFHRRHSGRVLVFTPAHQPHAATPVCRADDLSNGHRMVSAAACASKSQGPHPAAAAGAPALGDTTVHMLRRLDGLHAGDPAARDELIRAACERLTRLARKMLRDGGRLHRWEETGDVLQAALMRLHRALAQIAPGTPREFYRLAALQMRRELIDLARHHDGPAGAAAHHRSHPRAPLDGSQPAAGHHPDATGDGPEDLAVWTEFHERIGSLPEEQHEVFDLVWYQGLTHAAAAALLNVSTKTVQRRWHAACVSLHEAMHGELPRL
jgi:RNA polymerase sigma-70 factor (ECF subfamily)